MYSDKEEPEFVTEARTGTGTDSVHAVPAPKPYWERYQKEKGRLVSALGLYFILVWINAAPTSLLMLGALLALIILVVRTARASYLWRKHEFEGPPTTLYDKIKTMFWLALIPVIFALRACNDE